MPINWTEPWFMVNCPEGILSKDFLIQRDNKNVGGAVYAARHF